MMKLQGRRKILKAETVPVMRSRGIFVEMKLPCSCEVRKYAGGLIKFIPSSRCNLKNPHEKTILVWSCPHGGCHKKLPNKKALHQHRWEHAV